MAESRPKPLTSLTRADASKLWPTGWNPKSACCLWKVLLEHSHGRLFSCCLWLLLLGHRSYGPQSLKYLLSGPWQKKPTDPWSRATHHHSASVHRMQARHIHSVPNVVFSPYGSPSHLQPMSSCSLFLPLNPPLLLDQYQVASPSHKTHCYIHGSHTSASYLLNAT